jgi:hypothetical protein
MCYLKRICIHKKMVNCCMRRGRIFFKK